MQLTSASNALNCIFLLHICLITSGSFLNSSGSPFHCSPSSSHRGAVVLCVCSAPAIYSFHLMPQQLISRNKEQPFPTDLAAPSPVCTPQCVLQQLPGHPSTAAELPNLIGMSITRVTLLCPCSSLQQGIRAAHIPCRHTSV